MNCVILAPHQDDEVILCGTIMHRIKTFGYTIYMVFMTNGNYDATVHDVRLREALKVSELFGIPQKQVVFMGYANEYDEKGPHIYSASEGTIVKAKYDLEETYGIPEHEEYCYEKHGVHHGFTRENIFGDLYEIIHELKPELIIATGEEIHPDHSANSLLLDEVLGIVMHELQNYRPIVLKRPEYHTSWIGNEDYTDVNNASTKFDFKTKKTLVNGAEAFFFDPYLRWKDRLRIPIDSNSESTVKSALNLYASQNAAGHYNALMNSDAVFWMRRTDSITYNAVISASSGEASFLNDFKRNDSNDIKRKSSEIWEQNASIWRPDPNDLMPEINIEFDKEYCIGSIAIYQEYNAASFVTDCRIKTKDNTEIWRGNLSRYKATNASFDPIITRGITVEILQYSGKNTDVGITEIEVFSYKEIGLKLIKLMINDNFVYEYNVVNNIRQHLSVYAISDDGESHYSPSNMFEIRTIDEDGVDVPVSDIFDENYNIITAGSEGRTIWVEAFYNDSKVDCIKLKFPAVNRDSQLFFIGTPNHWNSGDHFIAQATIDYLEGIFPGKIINEIQINDFTTSIPKLRETITGKDLIVLQGGGNMGNVYPTNEAIRRKVFELFPYNKIVVFPETLFYEKTEQGAYEEKASVKIYAGAKQLTLCARERESFERMKELYPNSRIVLVPDIVCSMKIHVSNIERSGVSLFIRNDGEKSISEEVEQAIISELRNRKLSFEYFDMIYNHNKGYSGKANRKIIMSTKIKEIAKSKLVITDRLHAMILCVMTGTPCVVYYGYNHKIPSMYETWFDDIPYISLMTEGKQLSEAVDEVLTAPIDLDEITSDLFEKFRELKDVLVGE